MPQRGTLEMLTAEVPQRMRDAATFDTSGHVVLEFHCVTLVEIDAKHDVYDIISDI